MDDIDNNDLSKSEITVPAHIVSYMNMVDLHGLSVEESKNVVNRYIANAEEINTEVFRFVTGRGNHPGRDGVSGKLYQEFPNWISEENHTKIASIAKKDGFYEVRMKASLKKGIFYNFLEKLDAKMSAKEIENIKNSAEKGNAQAQYKLGYCYLHGNGVEQNEKLAAEWYRKSAEQGYSPAQHALGGCYWQGQGVRQSDEEAIRLFKASAAQNNADALNQLGDIYTFGAGVEENVAEAFRCYQRAADLGLDLAKRKMAHAYMAGRGVDKNENKAFALYKEVADKGDSYSGYNTACCYLHGLGTEKNIPLAFKYAKQSADQHDPDAQYLLSGFYQMGIGTQLDYEKSLVYLKKAAANQQKHAVYQLACYPETLSNIDQYIKALIKAARLGQIIAQAKLLKFFSEDLLLENGMPKGERKIIYENFWRQPDKELFELARNEDKLLVADIYAVMKDLTKKQKAKVLRLFEQLGKEGCTEAYARLGYFYLDGVLVKSHSQKALDYFHKGAEMGASVCLCYLGYYYENKFKNLPQPDYAKALGYYQRAAEKGDANSHNQLGLYYQNGLGIKQDLNKAIEHFEEAAKLDDPENKDKKEKGLFCNSAFPYSTYNLGSLYWKLSEVSQSKERSEELRVIGLMWFLKSKESGHEKATEMINELDPKIVSYGESNVSNFWKAVKPEKEKDSNSSVGSLEKLNTITKKIGFDTNWKISKKDEAWCCIPADKISIVEKTDIKPFSIRKTTDGKSILLLEQVSKIALDEIIVKLQFQFERGLRLN